ncbi:hypothetical protein [Paraburkholderia sp.]|uniref:hypothetical protein n=1 Tax=Paraburkholderia sp. TaxID=1926495 RepID=UPI0023A420CC|nr:hypothetical protein [Paraburkholderia sp.]MDE1181093.1 hypothetical protein [Paraburkholderia sp.]
MRSYLDSCATLPGHEVTGSRPALRRYRIGAAFLFIGPFALLTGLSCATIAYLESDALSLIGAIALGIAGATMLVYARRVFDCYGGAKWLSQRVERLLIPVEPDSRRSPKRPGKA